VKTWSTPQATARKQRLPAVPRSRRISKKACRALCRICTTEHDPCRHSGRGSRSGIRTGTRGLDRGSRKVVVGRVDASPHQANSACHDSRHAFSRGTAWGVCAAPRRPIVAIVQDAVVAWRYIDPEQSVHLWLHLPLPLPGDPRWAELPLEERAAATSLLECAVCGLRAGEKAIKKSLVTDYGIMRSGHGVSLHVHCLPEAEARARVEGLSLEEGRF